MQTYDIAIIEKTYFSFKLIDILKMSIVPSPHSIKEQTATFLLRHYSEMYESKMQVYAKTSIFLKKSKYFV